MGSFIRFKYPYKGSQNYALLADWVYKSPGIIQAKIVIVQFYTVFRY